MALTQIPATRSGINLLSKTTLASATSVSLNNVFSSQYDNYRILFQGHFAAGATDVEMRLRVSGTDNSSSIYYGGRGTTDLSSTFLANGTNAATKWFMCTPTTASGHFAIDVLKPFDITFKTTFSGTFLSRHLDRQGYNAGFHDTEASFDGFSIFFVNPCIGTLSVYGYGV